MKYNRRTFIRQASLAATLPLAFSQFSSCTSESKKETTSDKPGFLIDQYGIQLWTVKDQMAIDPKATLRSIASFGYKQIESFGGENGIFWGMSPAEFKAYLNEIGLTAVGSHCNPDYTIKTELKDEFRQLAEDAATVGMQYLINPFPGPVSTYDDWMKVAEGLNQQGEICKEFGLKSGYHNHHGEFMKVGDDQIPLKLLLDNTDADLVDFEMDIYWVVKAQQDPVKWLTDYPNRFRLCHIKDLHKPGRIAEIESSEPLEGDFWPSDTSCQLGTGQIDYTAILPVAKEKGVKEFIVEQERFDNSTSMKDAEKDASYMNQFLPKA